MPNLGGLRTLEQLSPDKSNASSVVSLTYTEMANLPTNVQVGLVHCLSTGGGFIKDVIYRPIYDESFVRTSWLAVVQKHKHDADDDISGGSLIDIYYANGDKAALIDYYKLNTSEFRFFGSFSGGSYGFDDSESNTTSVAQVTGITANNNITAQGDGIRLLWSNIMRWDMRIRCSHNSALVVRLGVNVDRLDESQSSSRAQIGIEGCDGHGTNWVIITANGDSGSLTATATVLSLISAADLYTMKFVPATEARLYYAGVSQAASGVGSTPDADSGSTDANKQWRMGIKTINTTSKKLNFWGGQQIGVPHGGF